MRGKILSDTNKEYIIEDGVPHLYDKLDVSPFLIHDREVFFSIYKGEIKSPNHDEITAAYQIAKRTNTDFMFTQLCYEHIAERNVIEIGVASCDLISKFANMGAKAYAVDFFTWEMLAAHDQHRKAGGADFEMISAVMCTLPFASASADIIYLHAALHHALPKRHRDFKWSDPQNMVDCLCEIRRVLKPDGAFFLLGENIYPADVTADQRVHELNCQANPGTVFESAYTLAEYEAAFAASGIYPTLYVNQHGLKVIATTYLNGERQEAIRPTDDLSLANYTEFGAMLSAGLRTFPFPAWITLL
jgi:ubiquinone/menaquinone biosynthesis C-methylase UbiE